MRIFIELAQALVNRFWPRGDSGDGSPRRSHWGLSSKYRIVHDPELGYSAQVFDRYWQAIEPDGTLGYAAENSVRWSCYWHKTEAEAGAVLNKHATNRGQKTVWSG